MVDEYATRGAANAIPANSEKTSDSRIAGLCTAPSRVAMSRKTKPENVIRAAIHSSCPPAICLGVIGVDDMPQYTRLHRNPDSTGKVDSPAAFCTAALASIAGVRYTTYGRPSVA